MFKTIEAKLETVMTHLEDRHEFYSSAVVLGVFAITLLAL